MWFCLGTELDGGTRIGFAKHAPKMGRGIWMGQANHYPASQEKNLSNYLGKTYHVISSLSFVSTLGSNKRVAKHCAHECRHTPTLINHTHCKIIACGDFTCVRKFTRVWKFTSVWKFTCVWKQCVGHCACVSTHFYWSQWGSKITSSNVSMFHLCKSVA